MYSLCYGKDSVSFTLPAGCNPDWITYRREPIASQSCITNALDHPINSLRIAEAARNKKSAVIIISDGSRLCPSYLFLERILMELNTAGIPDSKIMIIVALGMHRKQTKDELVQLVGEAVYERIRVMNHSPLSEDCVMLGTSRMGTPIEINKLVVEADFRIVTGNLEPHALAGISGGVKALVPGTASHRCIEHNHALSQIYTTKIGEVDNELRQDLEEVLNFIPVHFLLNVIVDHQQLLLGAVAGDVIAAHRKGVDIVKNRFLVEVSQLYDVVVVSPGGSPKDTQLYQSLKALKNASAITKPGGKIIGIASCGEGLGNGMLQYWVDTIQDRKVMVSKLKEKFVLGAHKITHIDQILENHEVFLYSQLPAPIVELLGFHPVRNLQSLFNEFLSKPNHRYAVMPFGGLTFPVATFL